MTMIDTETEREAPEAVQPVGARHSRTWRVAAAATVAAAVVAATLFVTNGGGGGAMTAGDLAERFDCSWPTVTRHLQRLVQAKLLNVEGRGRERWYTLDAARLRDVTSLYLDPFG